MDELYSNILQLNENIDNVIKRIEEEPKIITELYSYELLKVTIKLLQNERGKKVIQDNADTIINKCISDFSIYDYITLRELKNNKIEEEAISDIFKSACYEVLTKKTMIFLNNLRMTIENNIDTITDQEVYDLIFKRLQSMNTEASSTIVFDLYLLPDFKKELENRYPVVKVLVDAYQKKYPETAADNMFKGSTIIGKLIQENNQHIIRSYLELMLKGKSINQRNIKMVGGGGSCLVYKIGDNVIKIGEERHCRKILINHRILASKLRKLIKDPNGKELFYVEVMRYVETEGITKEDLLELKKDLYDMGIIWDDAKLANCGILPDDYDNVSPLKVDHIEVAAEIKDDLRREQFRTRKRRVVVIDSDDMRYNPLKSVK